MTTKDMLMEEAYILVHWPDSQDYMECDWFAEEAYLADSSAYFIPIRYILDEMINSGGHL